MASKQLVSDGAMLGEIDQLRHTLELAKASERYNSQGLADQVPRLERQLQELAEKAAEDALLVTVQALPAEQFDDIARRHPPSAEQLDRWREQSKVFPLSAMPEYNDRTMAADLLAACLVEPAWSEAWWRELSRGTQNQVWNLALSAQVSGADLPFFNAATATTNGGGGKSTTPAKKASRSPSS